MSTKIYASQDWVEERLAELSVEVDPSLAIEGMAADAKAVGEAINEVSALVGDTFVSEQINDAIENSKPDWNQNDENAIDYIKNRTHWVEEGQVVLVPETTVEIYEPGYPEYDLFQINLIEGQTYDVTWNGTVYSCDAYFSEEANCVVIGCGAIAGLSSGGNNEPFLCAVMTDNGGSVAYNTVLLFANAAGTYTIEISTIGENVHKLDPKYLPDGGVGYTEIKDTTVEYPGETEEMLLNGFPIFYVEDTVTVFVDGVKYSLVAFDNDGYPTIGDSFTELFGGGGEYGWAIFIATNNENIYTIFCSTTPHIVSYTAKFVHEIHEEYLPSRIFTSLNEAWVEIKKLRQIKNFVAIEDSSVGKIYALQIKDGEIVYTEKPTKISVAINPTKREYIRGEYFDPTGLVLRARYEDKYADYGYTSRNIDSGYSWPTEYLDKVGDYVYLDIACFDATTSVSVSVREFDPVTYLVDFDYTDNGDGTYTLTGWKGTLNGEPSTRMVIPDNGLIKF